MAAPTVTQVTQNTWTELIAPVTNASDATFQCVRDGSYEFTNDTSLPEDSEVGWMVRDTEIRVFRLAASEGLYARGIRGSGTAEFRCKVVEI